MWCDHTDISPFFIYKGCVCGEKQEEKIDKWKKMVKMEM